MIAYKVEKLPQKMPDVEVFLNELGADNWEFVAFDASGAAIFKKQGAPNADVAMLDSILKG